MNGNTAMQETVIDVGREALASAMRSTTSESGSASRLMGALLVDAGKLKQEHVERILRTQREHRLRFGEAAVKLGLVSRADIETTLSRQFDFPYLRQTDLSITSELVAAFQPFSSQVETLRGLRSQLMLRWFGGPSKRQTLAIVSPENGEGRSFIAANLAVVFSQLGERTLLIDGDLRTPRQHALFKLDNRAGLSAILSGRGGSEMIRPIPSLPHLSVLPTGSLPPNPQELLSRPEFTQMLSELSVEFDIILVDTPAGRMFADAQTVAARAGGALMIMHRNFTRVRDARNFAQNLLETGTPVVGTALNSF